MIKLVVIMFLASIGGYNFCKWRICKVMNNAWETLTKANEESSLSNEFINGAVYIDDVISKVV